MSCRKTVFFLDKRRISITYLKQRVGSTLVLFENLNLTVVEMQKLFKLFYSDLRQSALIMNEISVLKNRHFLTFYDKSTNAAKKSS